MARVSKKKMKKFAIFLVLVTLALPAVRADIQTDWAYHSSGHSGRYTDLVPGEDFCFLPNGAEAIPNDDTITLYVLTAHDFAGPADEQIFVRWWDGRMSHWIMGVWVKNITLHAEPEGPTLRDLPAEGSVLLDLWKVDIPAWVTQPGDNFYAIQLKGYSPDGMDERYLLCKPGGDFSQTNNVGQIWSASEEFDGQDWRVEVLP